MADALYVACAEVLSLCQSMKDDLAALLDPEKGFAPRLRDVCREQEDIELLRLESNTWGLLQAVMPYSTKTEPPSFTSARALLLENPYTPTSTLAQAIMNASPLLTELIVVREWLQETAPLPSQPEANTGLRTGQPGLGGLVREMDPDALGREEGKGLAADDASYERSLLQALYGYVRAGRLDDAVELCRRAHQPWRAASIRGSLLFQWKAISTEEGRSDDEDAMQEDDDSQGPSGNKNRRLWKSMCTRAALNPASRTRTHPLRSPIPSPATSTILKSACRTWEDHLWAQISIMCEEKESMELQKIGGAFWDPPLRSSSSATKIPETSTQAPEVEAREAEEKEWEKEVVGALENLKSIKVAEGPKAEHAFHFSQLWIVLDRIDALVDVFARGLVQGEYVRGGSEWVVLEAYLQVLEDAGQHELIAMYAGALGENAIDRYALFLVSLGLSADIGERRMALTRARDHGLDMERVAIAAAERSVDKAFEVLPPLKGPLPSIIAFQSEPSEAEMFLLRSIEWTTFMDTTYEIALEQANVILRYFLASGRVQISQQLLDILPPELASIAEPEERATEYLHYRQEDKAWVAEYRELIEQAYEQILKLLTSEWLVTDVESPAGDKRRKELVRIRQIYVPELIIRLHFLLYDSRHVILENLKLALDLTNVVADSRYRLYEDFVNEAGRKLGDYLSAVRQAVIGGLEGGGSDPFRVITCH
ncbi:107-domain-containing protein [Cyathus striatus]|nr:107-domain-containing protein [Cyathus striatus]